MSETARDLAPYEHRLIHHGPAEVPLELRIWPRVQAVRDGCWLWTGSVSTNGYAVLSRLAKFGSDVLIHRWVYEHFIGAIPEGLHIDHLCRVRRCVNPLHLEPVTVRENILRGVSPSAHNARATHCKQGHPFSPVNTYRLPDGERRCRQCVSAEKKRKLVRLRARGLTSHGTPRIGYHRKPVCNNGHPLQGDNIVLKMKRGYTYQVCRICRNAQARKDQARRMEREAR